MFFLLGFDFAVNFFIKIMSDTDSGSDGEDVDDEAPLEEGNRGRFRYGRRKNRLVQDIESSLDPADYHPMP